MKINPIIKKEMITLFRSNHISKGKQLGSLLMTIFFNLAFLSFVLGLFILFYNKTNNIISTNGVPAPLLVFILFMAIVVVSYILFFTNSFSNTLYNRDDRFILRVMPLKETEILLPKLGAAYIKLLSTFGLLFLSLLITFGLLVINNPCGYITISWWYWLVSILATLVVPIIIMFFAAILSYPFHLLKEFIGRHPVIQIIVSIVLITLLSLAYFFIIHLFATLVRTDSLVEILRPSNCDMMYNIAQFLIPVYSLIAALVVPNQGIQILYFIIFFLVSLGSLYFIVLAYYRNYVKVDDKFSVIKIQEPTLSKYPLLKKDFKLMFRNTSGSVSFIVLAFTSAIFSTFLAYFVGSIFDTYGLNKTNPSELVNSEFDLLNIAPQLYFPLIVLFVTLAISVIFASETKLFLKEKRTVSVILTMPQAFKKQILSKMFLNLVLLLIVNVLVFILVASIGILPIVDALILFTISLFVTFSSFLLGVSHTLSVTKSLSATSDIANVSNFNFVISIIFPIVAFIITGGLVVGAYYLGLLSSMSPTIIYLLVVLITGVILAFSIYLFIRRSKRFSKFLSEGVVGK